MQSISQPDIEKLCIYEVNINFDEASELWRTNKKSIGNGSYKYICCALNKKGNRCGVKRFDCYEYCKTHCKKFASPI